MKLDFSLIPTLTLFTMMLALGMSLKGADFTRILQARMAVGFGLIGQLLLLPMVAFAIAHLLDLSHFTAIGVVLIAACPGGVTSNVLSHYARGDVALSVSLTAISSAFAWLTVPVVVGLGLAHFAAEEATMPLSAFEAVTTLFSSTALPLLLGMATLRFRPSLAERLRRPVLLTSTCVLMLLVVGLGASMVRQVPDPGELIQRTLIPVVALVSVMTGLARLGARFLGLSPAQARTLALELGIQNFNLAMVFALQFLNEPRYLGPALIYLPVMLSFGLAQVALAPPGDRARSDRRPLDVVQGIRSSR